MKVTVFKRKGSMDAGVRRQTRGLRVPLWRQTRGLQTPIM